MFDFILDVEIYGNHYTGNASIIDVLVGQPTFMTVRYINTGETVELAYLTADPNPDNWPYLQAANFFPQWAIASNIFNGQNHVALPFQGVITQQIVYAPPVLGQMKNIVIGGQAFNIPSPGLSDSPLVAKTQFIRLHGVNEIVLPPVPPPPGTQQNNIWPVIAGAGFLAMLIAVDKDND